MPFILSSPGFAVILVFIFIDGVSWADFSWPKRPNTLSAILARAYFCSKVVSLVVRGLLFLTVPDLGVITSEILMIGLACLRLVLFLVCTNIVGLLLSSLSALDNIS